MSKHDGSGDDPHPVIVVVRSEDVEGLYVRVARLVLGGAPGLCLVMEEGYVSEGEPPAVVGDKNFRPITARSEEALRKKAKKRGLIVSHERFTQGSLRLVAK